MNPEAHFPGGEIKARSAGDEAQIKLLTLSNPGARNALSPAIYAAGIEAINQADSSHDVRAVVITGEGETFCAGGNLQRLQYNRSQAPQVQADSIDGLHAWIEAIRACRKPVIAAVEGAAAGAGFSLALACDLARHHFADAARQIGCKVRKHLDTGRISLASVDRKAIEVAPGLPWRAWPPCCSSI